MASSIHDFRRSKLFRAAIIVPTIIALIFSVFNLTAPNDPENFTDKLVQNEFRCSRDPETKIIQKFKNYELATGVAKELGGQRVEGSPQQEAEKACGCHQFGQANRLGVCLKTK